MANFGVFTIEYASRVQRKKPLEKRWTESDLKVAVEEVWCKSTISAAVKQYRTPRTTLADHVHRRRVKVGAGSSGNMSGTPANGVWTDEGRRWRGCK